MLNWNRIVLSLGPALVVGIGTGCSSNVPNVDTGEHAGASVLQAEACVGTATACDGTCDGQAISIGGSWSGRGPTEGEACSAAVAQCWNALAAQCGGTFATGYASCSASCGQKRTAREFENFWNKNNGLFNFGIAITDSREENLGGGNYLTQVFERHRLELHPENKGTPYEVLLGRIGAELVADRGYEDTPAWKNGSIAVDPRFQATYNANRLAGIPGAGGSLALYGRPLAPAAWETLSDGKSYFVQWFERARFEHHPENAGTKYEVLLGLLGKEAMDSGLYY